MKNLKHSLFPCLMLAFLSGCFKKQPYQEYRSTYRTEGAKKFDEKVVTPQEATRKNIKNMSLPEVRAARIHFEEQDDLELVEKTLNRIIKLSDNYQEKADCLYELATIQLCQGKLEKAREYFDQLRQEYPGAPFKKEASYRNILAHYWDCSDAQRDQEMTEKTVALIKGFQQEFPDYFEYRENIEKIEDDCNRILFDAEKFRLNFYLDKYHINPKAETLTSAQMRLAYILEKLLEAQKQISSQEKDNLIDLFEKIRKSDEDAQEKYKLLTKAALLLESEQ